MGKCIILLLAGASFCLAGCSSTKSTQRELIGTWESGRIPAQRHPPKEDTYTITSVLQLLQPVNPADMNDDFQDARVLAQDKDSLTVEVTYYPLRQVSIGENPNWRKDYAGMTEYLKATPTENWDETMRRDLLAELRQDGIDPDKLTDKQLVEEWMHASTHGSPGSSGARWWLHSSLSPSAICWRFGLLRYCFR